MKTVVFIVSVTLAIALAGICNGADVFYLTNSVDHTNYGPFEYLHGGKVTIGSQTLEIRRLLTDDERLKYRLQKIVVPEIDFRGAKLSNVVACFQSAVAVFERSNEEGTNTIQFILAGRPDEDIPLGAQPVKEEFALRYVSLYTAIREVCRLANLDYMIQNDAVIFTKHKSDGGQQAARERRDKLAPQP